jgi:hypothetical protein
MLAIAGLAWSALLFSGGGFDVALFGGRITSNDPFRPMLVAAAGLALFFLAGGRISARNGLLRSTAAARAAQAFLRRAVPSPRTLACTLAVLTAILAWVYGTKAVGGADSYGYLSQAELWAAGLPRVHQPFVAELDWPRAHWAFAPIGSYRPISAYRRVEGADTWTIVPLYPPGLPMLIALANVLGGHQAKFMVVPFLTGVLVLATYGIGVRLASPAAGLAGAWLVATSPVVLFMMMTTMSDVPVSGLWAAAIFYALGATYPGAIMAGLLLSVAVLVRPNLGPLLVALGLMYAVRTIDPATRRAALRQGTLFALACLPGIVSLGLINKALYGAALTSGYGNLGELFSLSNVGPNLRLYLGWLVDAHTPVVLAGLVAVGLPMRRLWPAAATRPTLIVIGFWVLTVWAIYLIYVPWDAWWYLRFLMPVLPCVMVGTGAVAAALTRRWPSVMRPIAVVAIILLGVFQLRTAVERDAFRLWEGERRFVVGARMANAFTEENSLIIAGQHSGSMRYYGGRMTAQFDYVPMGRVDRLMAWLEERGVHPYLLVEDWEVERVRERFAGQQAAAVLDRPPRATYRHPGTLHLFDLSTTARSDGPPVIWTGTYRDLLAAPPGAAPRLALLP